MMSKIAVMMYACVCVICVSAYADNQTKSTQQISDFSLTGFGDQGKKAGILTVNPRISLTMWSS